MKSILRLLKRHRLLILLLFVFMSNVVTLALLFPEHTPYDYYQRLSVAFTHGKLCLSDNPAWLNELIPVPGKGYCVVYPIAPSLVMLPFVLINQNISQTTIAQIIFGLTACVVFLLLRKEQHSMRRSLFFAYAWNWATIFLSMSAVGSAWYIAQTIGSFLLLLSLLVIGKTHRSLFAAGFFLSFAAISRLPLHLYVFYFACVLFLQRKQSLQVRVIHIIIFGLGFLPCFLLQRGYNIARYGTFSDAGYYMIQGKFDEPDFANGEFNIVNIPKHAAILFAKFPLRTPTFPYLVPSYYGLTIFLTSPCIVVGFFMLLRERRWAEVGTIFMILLLEMSHGTVGFTQFGYRFALDAYPFAFLGFARSSKHISRPVIFALVGISVIVNFWGLLSFRFGWFTW